MESDKSEYSKEHLSRLSDGELQAEWTKYMAYSRERQNLREAAQRMLRKKSPQRQVKLAEIPEGAMTAAKLGEREILLANVGSKIYAIDNACGHSGYPLNEGHLEGCIVSCAWHGARFDVRTGEAVSQGIDIKPIKRFQFKISPEGYLEMGEEL